MQTNDVCDSLDAIGQALAPIATNLTQIHSDDSADVRALLSAARNIQRLVDGVITEVIQLSTRGDAPLPAEAFLGGSGPVPRSQLHAEIERSGVVEEFPLIGAAHRTGQVHVSRAARSPSGSQRVALRALYPRCRSAGSGGNRSRFTMWCSSASQSAPFSTSSSPSAGDGITCGLRPPRVVR